MARETGKEKMASKDNRYVSGISWRLFVALAIFVIVTLAIIWIFQVLFLNVFYEDSKLDEFEIIQNEIRASVDDREKLQGVVFGRSVGTDTCIRVFQINDGSAEEIAGSDVNVGCIIHHVSSDFLARLYSQAAAGGGSYTKKVQNSAISSPTSTVHARLIETDSGKVYMILLDSELVPLDATVKTLERQFGWIMSLLIMGALILALVMSRIICEPMKKMSRSARGLAHGNYNEKFEGGRYREAVELADALNYAASELAKNDNLQKELVANISHDLRTPLTMIKGYSEVMRDIPGENTPENVQVVIDETERLTELVNDMLDLSKIQSGTRKPESEVFDLTETVRSVMMRYEKLTEKDGYRISFDAACNVLIRADRTMILQVIYNLINNALNYTGEDKRVLIVQTVENNRVRISVTDTGEGIEEEYLSSIWDRYYKVDKVHKRAKIGTGLGLSIVKSILEAHGARYGVESEIGKGSTFYFETEVSAFCDGE